MTEARTASRRVKGDDAIYFDASKSRYVGAVSLGHGADGRRIRRKVTGPTKAEVRDKLKALHRELDSNVGPGRAIPSAMLSMTGWLTGWQACQPAP